MPMQTISSNIFLPKASDVVKKAEDTLDNALKEATLLAKKLEKESVIDEEEVENGFYTTIDDSFEFLSDIFNFCCVLLIIILIYYFYKGYASGRGQYGGSNIELDKLSDYTYD